MRVGRGSGLDVRNDAVRPVEREDERCRIRHMKRLLLDEPFLRFGGKHRKDTAQWPRVGKRRGSCPKKGTYRDRIPCVRNDTPFGICDSQERLLVDREVRVPAEDKEKARQNPRSCEHTLWLKRGRTHHFMSRMAGPSTRSFSTLEQSSGLSVWVSASLGPRGKEQSGNVQDLAVRLVDQTPAPSLCGRS